MKEYLEAEPDTKAIDDAVAQAKRAYMRDYYTKNKQKYKTYKERHWLKKIAERV